MKFYADMQKFQFQESGSCNMYTFYFKEGKFNRLVCWDEPTERTEFDYSKEELRESYFEEAIYALIRSREVFEIKGGNEWLSFVDFVKMIIEDNKFGPFTRKIFFGETERLSAIINGLTGAIIEECSKSESSIEYCMKESKMKKTYAELQNEVVEIVKEISKNDGAEVAINFFINVASEGLGDDKEELKQAVISSLEPLKAVAKRCDTKIQCNIKGHDFGEWEESDEVVFKKSNEEHTISADYPFEFKVPIPVLKRKCKWCGRIERKLDIEEYE